MKTSARNQFSGVITEVIIGSVNAEVKLELAGGESIVAAVTKESISTLGIKTGINAVALVKAPQIIIVTDFEGYKISARNQLSGVISSITPGAVNAEIDIELKGGQIIATTVTQDSNTTLGLHKGQTVTAVFKAGSVILAIPN